mmetsp:Transcript_5784/g.12246  ORF Transcript_5784/g.12246 Transcript_5784/m.12246 type:complete len:183 (-) Transcript_5784:35-583(-)
MTTTASVARPRRSCSTGTLVLAATLLSGTTIDAFSIRYHSCLARRRNPQPRGMTSICASRHSPHSPLEDDPGQRDDSYWDQLQQASKDPILFEKFIEESMRKEKVQAEGGRSQSAPGSPKRQSDVRHDDGMPKKTGKYIPIEQWDAERTDNLTREERIQWEAQRDGNRFAQNEILARNLKSF